MPVRLASLQRPPPSGGKLFRQYAFQLRLQKSKQAMRAEAAFRCVAQLVQHAEDAFNARRQGFKI